MFLMNLKVSYAFEIDEIPSHVLVYYAMVWNSGYEDYKKAIALSQLCYWLSDWIGLWVRDSKAILVTKVQE